MPSIRHPLRSPLPLTAGTKETQRRRRQGSGQAPPLACAPAQRAPRSPAAQARVTSDRTSLRGDDRRALGGSRWKMAAAASEERL